VGTAIPRRRFPGDLHDCGVERDLRAEAVNSDTSRVALRSAELRLPILAGDRERREWLSADMPDDPAHGPGA